MFRRLLLALLWSSLLAWPAEATWSIIVVNRRTGEVAVGGATCLANTNLLQIIPAVAVGKGAGCIQSRGNAPALVVLYDELVAGSDPQQVIDALGVHLGAVNSYQFGVVAFDGAPATFTGAQAGKARGGVRGEVGDLAYAIQGNVLAGSPVWLNARDALIDTPGDLAAKLMAAMEAARAAGGDGRCSCDLGRPSSCGSPPPSFTKSAHCGFMVVARMGDVDGACLNGPDCAAGSYFMKLNIKGTNSRHNAPDPVLQLQELYDDWRIGLAGVPDGLASTVSSVQSLPADGITQRVLTVRLADIEGTPLGVGGRDVRLEPVEGTSTLISVGSKVDNGDGSYSIPVTAGTTPGTEQLVVTVNSKGRRIHLYPYLELRSDAVAPLHVGYDQVSAGEAPLVPFVLDVPVGASAPYVILGSLSGTTPGTVVGGVNVPLNTDTLTWSTLLRAGDPNVLPGTIGVLDASGRAEAGFDLGPGQLLSVAGLRFDWAGLVLGGPASVATNAVGFDIVP